MTCDECQAIVIDIARGRDDIDRALRDEARRHAALCSRCGEQRQEQEWLTAQLRAIATAEAAWNAPERVETAVLAAWRAEYGSAAAAMRAGAPGGALRRWMVPSVVLGGLAVAAIAMVFVWPSLRGGSGGSTTGSSPVTSIGASARGVNSASGAATSSTPGTGARRESNSQSKEDSSPVAHEEAPAATLAPATMRAHETTSARIETVLARATMRRETEFQPLPYVEPLRSTEARHVVRLSMTGGDEVILGMLPSDHRNGQPFEADVLVGEDGIARAIRIVR